MSAVEYVPGTWVAVVGERTWLLLAVAPESGLVRRCWDLVRTDEPLDEVLAGIVHEGFRAVSGFALVRLAPGEKRAVVRGAARLQFADASGAVDEINAAGVGTWVDRNLGEVARMRIATGAAGPALPVRGGVVLAGELAVSLSDTPQEDVAGQEEVVELTVVRDEPRTAPQVPAAPPPQPQPAPHLAAVPQPLPTPPVPQVTQITGVIQSLDWAPPAPAAPRPEPATVVQAEPVTDTVLRTNVLSPNETRMLHPGSTSGPQLVRAKKCPAGHLSSDYAVHCRVCEVPLPEQDAAMLPMPVLGLLRLSNGDTITLDRNVVMGRDPSGDRRGVNLVQVGRENDTEISRTHVEVRLEGWDVLVRDLGSMNGTSVARPGCPPQKLAAHIEEFLYPGTRVVLGDQFSFTFEVNG
ncbi:FHA domain-containing protein [Lentzea sp. HUAS12]|uniref:FHA domain-containing protein n=1 Tax=Lentzea sp. HUAS12 TaxID=2951806 RepID=UPI0020A1476E|nr:FHA domain-containing protein [Lentzea sp. HUAS12]USX52263.1 FHA domain-containing protein [Lentzea sp. HUAS12]